MDKAVIEFFQRQRNHPSRCFYCGAKLITLRFEGKPHPMARFVRNQYTIDHLEPMSLGGSKKKRNKVTCCRGCNNDKGRKTVEQYRRFVFGDKPVEFYAERLYRAALLKIEYDREADGRWIAEVSSMPGVLAYGATQQKATAKVLSLAASLEAQLLAAESSKNRPEEAVSE